MALFRCEACGAGLEVKAGSKIAYCPYCGMKQTLSQEAAKILKTAAKIENLLKRGFMLLEEGEFKKADKYFDKVLDEEPENGRAYFGKLMVRLKASDAKKLAAIMKSGDFSGKLLQRVLDFQPELIRDMFTEDYNRAVNLMNEEKYREAIKIFDSIGSYYHEASEKAEEIRNKFRPKREEAMRLFREEKYDEAHRIFDEVDYYFAKVRT